MVQTVSNGVTLKEPLIIIKADSTLQFDPEKDGEINNKLWPEYYAKPEKDTRLSFKITVLIKTNSFA